MKIAADADNGKPGNTYITYKNGKLKESGKYDEKGKKTGEWKFYSINGDLESIGLYESGEKHGEWSDYYPNGKILKTGNYINGKQVAEWRTYHSSGQLSSVAIFKDGKQIGKTKLYNLQGKSTSQKALHDEMKELMKTDFKKFYISLQQKNFE
ncbi:toxin-antitoxin system YwqK family antitoxin [Paenimyroides baculatum]|uniref:toxin-antitoxin system YwqK family antitoxin n=1 Tax=Paenimyroides baculatum TaxID=2608000 RepID=UPI00168184FE